MICHLRTIVVVVRLFCYPSNSHTLNRLKYLEWKIYLWIKVIFANEMSSHARTHTYRSISGVCERAHNEYTTTVQANVLNIDWDSSVTIAQQLLWQIFNVNTYHFYLCLFRIFITQQINCRAICVTVCGEHISLIIWWFLLVVNMPLRLSEQYAVTCKCMRWRIPTQLTLHVTAQCSCSADSVTPGDHHFIRC